MTKPTALVSVITLPGGDITVNVTRRSRWVFLKQVLVVLSLLGCSYTGLVNTWKTCWYSQTLCFAL